MLIVVPQPNPAEPVVGISSVIDEAVGFTHPFCGELPVMARIKGSGIQVEQRDLG